MNRERVCVLAAAFFIGTLAMPALAHADDPQPAPPAQGDAWDEAMKRGLKNEGRRTSTEQTEDETQRAEAQRKRSAEADVTRTEVAALREEFRFLIVGSAGYAGVSKQPIDTTRQFESGAGPEFQIGIGVRKGFGSRWELLAHGELTSISTTRATSFGNFSSVGSTSCSTCLSSSSTPGATSLLGGTGDVTGRVHFGGVRRPGYAGMGLRVDALGYSAESSKATTYANSPVIPVRSTTYDDKKLIVAPSFVIEAGIVIGKAEYIDLGFRVCVGDGIVHINVLNAAFAF